MRAPKGAKNAASSRSVQRLLAGGVNPDLERAARGSRDDPLVQDAEHDHPARLAAYRRTPVAADSPRREPVPTPKNVPKRPSNPRSQTFVRRGRGRTRSRERVHIAAPIRGN